MKTKKLEKISASRMATYAKYLGGEKHKDAHSFNTLYQRVVLDILDPTDVRYKILQSLQTNDLMKIGNKLEAEIESATRDHLAKKFNIDASRLDEFNASLQSQIDLTKGILSAKPDMVSHEYGVVIDLKCVGLHVDGFKSYDDEMRQKLELEKYKYQLATQMYVHNCDLAMIIIAFRTTHDLDNAELVKNEDGTVKLLVGEMRRDIELENDILEIASKSLKILAEQAENFTMQPDITDDADRVLAYYMQSGTVRNDAMYNFLKSCKDKEIDALQAIREIESIKKTIVESQKPQLTIINSAGETIVVENTFTKPTVAIRQSLEIELQELDAKIAKVGSKEEIEEVKQELYKQEQEAENELKRIRYEKTWAHQDHNISVRREALQKEREALQISIAKTDFSDGFVFQRKGSLKGISLK